MPADDQLIQELLKRVQNLEAVVDDLSLTVADLAAASSGNVIDLSNGKTYKIIADGGVIGLEEV